MSRICLTGRQWAFIRPFLPHPARTGRPRADDRRTIEGILYVLITGCRWQDLPREYGAPTTVWRRLKRWGEDSSGLPWALRRQGIAPCIPPKRRPARWRPKRGRPVLAQRKEYGLRYTVERSFAWLGNFRRLLIRWEHFFRVYRSGFAFVVMWICVRRVTAGGSTTLVQ